MIENGTLLQDRYLIERQIGAGGMGAVYLAVDQRFGSHVAIKETFYKDQQLGEAFEREARLLNSLLHPVLPHVSDYFTENAGYFLVMQFVEGEDLSDTLKREGAFPVGDVLRWTDSLLDALDYLHSQESPIIHRDIKPHNLKLTLRGDIILLDFGLAKLNAADDTTGGISVFGYSRTYSPLEQIQGTGTDARSDIFALGATIYHLLTGKPAIEALARAASIVNGKPDPLPLASEINAEVPVDVATVLNSALALNPDQRFGSAKAMRQALQHAVSPDSTKNIEDLPEELAFKVAAPIVNSAETENFPALEAFAAEVANDFSKTEADNQFLMAEVSIPDAQTPAPEVFQNSTAVVDVATQVAVPRTNQPGLRLAALAAVLICSGLSALYFIARAYTSDEPNQTPVVESTQAVESSSEQSAPESLSPVPKVSPLSSADNGDQAKTKPAVIEVISEKQKTADEPLAEVKTTEKPKPEPPPAEVPRSEPKKPIRRNESQRAGETRSRVIENAPPPDIESIFTGQTSEQRQIQQERQRRQAERRQQREQMSDEELEDLRRERRRRRLERQNRQPFPPF
ncbi:MAG: serine/threonine protein kinase [Acidobacteria bacterium]|nr:serine/threonine protein kinase [Acidobacteriota bacterium]MCA1639045.1 serine/threonine protein kinase [Acidobacteriota bacterium]